MIEKSSGFLETYRKMQSTTELDSIIRESLVSFASVLSSAAWAGRREREAVSLYAFGHLLKQVCPGSFLHDPAQIGIEIPVPQISEPVRSVGKNARRMKPQVCKDLVIWPQPAMTCWDQFGEPTIYPAAILEWKFGVDSIDNNDLKWLAEFSRSRPNFIGFAISANLPGKDFLIKVAKVSRGVADLDWLRQ